MMCIYMETDMDIDRGYPREKVKEEGRNASRKARCGGSRLPGLFTGARVNNYVHRAA